MDENETKKMYEKATFYAAKGIAVHISLFSKKFYNGILIEVNDLRIIIKDEVLGETYVPIDDIYDIEPREVKDG